MLHELILDKIYMRHAIDEAPTDQGFSMHIHDQCELYFFVSGNVEYLVEGSHYLLPANSIMIMRPSEVHRAKILRPETYERYAINFPTDYFSTIDPENRLIKAYMDRPLGMGNLFTDQELDTRFVKARLDEIDAAPSDYEKGLALQTRLPLILEMVYRAFSSRTTGERKPLSVSEQMVAYVNMHLFEKLSIPQLAQHFFLSTSQFSRHFKQATGASPWEYIIRKRLAAAKEKIRQGSTIQSACEACGFSDYSSFYRAYLKYLGHAPRIDMDKPL